MREHNSLSSLLIGTTLVCLATQPARADNTQITGVEVQANSSGIELTLKTVGEQQQVPQIFTTNQGNSLVTELLNTQIQNGGNFVKENPHPDIERVEVTQLEANRVQIKVNGVNNPVVMELQSPGGSQIAINFASEASTTGEVQDTSTLAQTPLPRQPTSAQLPATTRNSGFERVAPNPPEVLFPNPKITIDGVPAPAAGVVQPNFPAPPFLPRAVAPPVGDISVSNIDSTPELIDLGTAILVPRVVLRDAPVREVLALLARSAGLNLIYSSQQGQQGGQPGQPGAAQQTEQLGQALETTISLDLENEPVQEVFNYVLQLSGLEANRRGQSIFVAARLPQAAQNNITRSLRLNQVGAAQASSFLATFGAATQQIFIPTELIVNPETQAIIRQIPGRPEIISVTVSPDEEGAAPLLLSDLAISTDERLNSITMVGSPRKVQIATSLLTQLDARRRQVAVNVKIIDVNLLNTEDFNSSFSFGIADNFFSVNNGAFTGNVGEFRPPTQAERTASPFSRPITANPLPEGATAEPFFDRLEDALIPGQETTVNGVTFFSRPPFGTADSPFQPGVSEVEVDPETGQVTAEFTTPTLFQFPNKFLASLEAQITSGNAKILTDPTLVIQEGQQASVNLTQEVFGGVIRGQNVGQLRDQESIVTEQPIIKSAGLILLIDVNRIDDNGFVSLVVSPTVSSIGGTVRTGTSQGTIALLQERNLSSGEVRVRDGQTLILSGIIQEDERVSVSKVPILGDLPILGALFRSTEKTNQRNEVIVLLTPQILDDTERSNFGYSYTPGGETRQILQERGFPIQGR